MEPCIFCKIASGEIPSHKVYEDESTFAFLDIHPINPGHVLVIPKRHEPDFQRLDDATYGAVMTTVKRMAEMIDARLEPKRVGLLIAGWDVPHTHVHVVPMHDYHDLTTKSIIDGNVANPTSEELAEIVGRLKP